MGCSASKQSKTSGLPPSEEGRPSQPTSRGTVAAARTSHPAPAGIRPSAPNPALLATPFSQDDIHFNHTRPSDDDHQLSSVYADEEPMENANGNQGRPSRHTMNLVVHAFLAEIRMDHLEEAFVCVGYDDALQLQHLEETDLELIEQCTGIQILPGHRKKILLHSLNFRRLTNEATRATDPRMDERSVCDSAVTPAMNPTHRHQANHHVSFAVSGGSSSRPANSSAYESSQAPPSTAGPRSSEGTASVKSAATHKSGKSAASARLASSPSARRLTTAFSENGSERRYTPEEEDSLPGCPVLENILRASLGHLDADVSISARKKGGAREEGGASSPSEEVLELKDREAEGEGEIQLAFRPGAPSILSPVVRQELESTTPRERYNELPPLNSARSAPRPSPLSGPTPSPGPPVATPPSLAKNPLDRAISIRQGMVAARAPSVSNGSSAGEPTARVGRVSQGGGRTSAGAPKLPPSSSKPLVSQSLDLLPGRLGVEETPRLDDANNENTMLNTNNQSIRIPNSIASATKVRLPPSINQAQLRSSVAVPPTPPSPSAPAVRNSSAAVSASLVGMGSAGRKDLKAMMEGLEKNLECLSEKHRSSNNLINLSSSSRQTSPLRRTARSPAVSIYSSPIKQMQSPLEASGNVTGVAEQLSAVLDAMHKTQDLKMSEHVKRTVLADVEADIVNSVTAQRNAIRY